MACILESWSINVFEILSVSNNPLIDLPLAAGALILLNHLVGKRLFTSLVANTSFSAPIYPYTTAILIGVFTGLAACN